MLEVTPGEIHAWWARPWQARDSWRRLLDIDELARLDAYKQSEPRRMFLVGATIVRALFGIELGVSPAAVVVDRRCVECGHPHGKIRPTQSGLEISVSHSGGWVVVAASRSGPVGVDVEAISPGVDITGVGRVMLTSAEQRELLATSEDERPAAFARYWTRKEAVLKATGDGLRVPVSELEVSGPSCAPAVRFWRSRPWIIDRIQVRDIDPDGGHRASVATIGERLGRVAHHAADGILPVGAVSTENDGDGRSG